MTTFQNPTKSNRHISIDAFRALTMILMIFVNDLWSLMDIPSWLTHVSAQTDGMGLADIVFPAFLFIVGLSVPYAIQSRKKKGDSDFRIFFHILSRTVALLIMGFFFVNYENYSSEAELPGNIWMILLIIAFFLIWLDYKNPELPIVKVLKATGIIILLILVSFFETEKSSGITALKISWWGILGLIGWSYFISSSVFLFTKGKVIVQIMILILLSLMNAAAAMNWLTALDSIKTYFWIVGDGSMPALSIAGVITAIAYKNLTSKNKNFWIILVTFAFILIAYGVISRPLWGISKIRATPSWTTISSGIAILGFLLVILITDVKKATKWYKTIKPAGTSTLTSYLIPYIHYALIGLTGLQLPAYLRTGTIGLTKSLLYALTIVFITGLLEKRNIRLKI
ncbi:MAG: DUF5009 domain-containing protein [Pedobacter sp.]|nr:MAG: DUF5009 domain-containing protein [Pedobacter sp.]